MTVGPGAKAAVLGGGVFLFRDLWSPQVRTTSNKWVKDHKEAPTHPEQRQSLWLLGSHDLILPPRVNLGRKWSEPKMSVLSYGVT